MLNESILEDREVMRSLQLTAANKLYRHETIQKKETADAVEFLGSN